MKGSLFIISCCFIWMLSNGQMYPVPNNPYDEYDESPQAATFKSPLVRTLVSNLEPKEDTTLGTGNNRSFLNSFLQHLNARKLQNQVPRNNLELIIRDGLNTVRIEFLPKVFDSQGWNSTIDLLSDSLALVIQDVQRLGYKPNFHYSVLLGQPVTPPVVQYLPATALKSAAG